MTTPRLCILTTSFPRFSGDEASIFVGRLVDGFSQVGQSGLVVVPRDNEEPLEENRGMFTICRYRYGLFNRGALAFGLGIRANLKQDPLLAFQIPLFLLQQFLSAWKRRRSWEIIHANWIASGVTALALKVSTGAPFVLTVRGVDATFLRSLLLRPIVGLILRKADAIVSVNEAFLTEVRGRFQICEDRLQCIPNGVTLPSLSDSNYQTFLTDRNLDPQKRYVLFLSRVIPVKRVELLIEALGRDELKDVELLLVGRSESKYRDQLSEFAKRCNCQNRVRFEGPVSPEEVACYFRVSSAYASASQWEGRSNSLYEALFSGTPVVASDIPGHAEVVVHEHNGLLVGSEGGDGYARAIARLFSDEELRKRLVRTGKESVRMLTWEAAAEAYREIFQRVFDRP